MIRRRVRKLGGLLGDEGEFSFFAISARADAVVRAVKAAKFEGDARLGRKIKATFDRYLAKYFEGFAVTVPRGRGADSWMYTLWREDGRFLPCFDHRKPLDVKHHWASRLGHYPEVRVTRDVTDRFVVVVDDLVTTGTTLTGHVVALLKAGANATGLVLTVR